jgi:hypothetical protein
MHATHDSTGAFISGLPVELASPEAGRLAEATFTVVIRPTLSWW